MQAIPATTKDSIRAGPALWWAAYAGEHEDARADDAADAQAGQGPRAEHSAQAVLPLHFLVHQAERFSLEQMMSHRFVPVRSLPIPATPP